MKKNIFRLLSLAILVSIGVYTYQHIYINQVIILKNNQAVITRDSWVVGDSIFYKAKGDVYSIPLENVAAVKNRGLFNKGYGTIIIIKRDLSLWKSKTLGLISQAKLKKNAYNKYGPMAGVAVIGIILAIAVVLLIKKILKSIKLKKKAPDASKEHVRDKKVYKGQDQIAQFFLNIFKCQKGASPDAETSFRSIKRQTPDGNHIYELRVKMENDWASRRMSIGPIGEESGSRSTCYYVIFDDHIVVKVPPKPITSFNKYIRSIDRDNWIAKKISPKECLIPKVSVILKKIHPIPEDADMTAERLEDKYIGWLKENKDFHKHLKIGSGFAYFMDLSKYFFLNHILKKIHNIEEKIFEEIMRGPELIWNPVEFEARYGAQHADLCDRLLPVYSSFRNRTHDLMLQHHMGDSVSEFTIKQWFLLYLSNRKLTASDLEQKPSIVSDMNTIALKVFNQHRQPVENYQQMIRVFVVTMNLKQQNSQISSLIINLLNLLVWLEKAKVSMRDLKPDNLIVAGNPSKFPQFLTSANLFSIGLIDVETAVSYDASDKKGIRQPPLGGTPSFATLSHQMKNETIQAVYKDIETIFQLQDWYATIGMIYQVITGERLFGKTARTLLRLKKTIKEKSGKIEGPPQLLADTSRTFWETAVKEFETKTKENEKRLKYISLITTKESNLMLLDFIVKTHKCILKAIQRRISTQTTFKGDKFQKSLYTAPALKIKHFKIKFQQEQMRKVSGDEREKAMTLLEDLEFLKKQSEKLIAASNVLKKSVPIISSCDLLETMFIIVLVHMHQDNWGIVSLK